MRAHIYLPIHSADTEHTFIESQLYAKYCSDIKSEQDKYRPIFQGVEILTN